jgi:hypothetical protein
MENGKKLYKSVQEKGEKIITKIISKLEADLK